MDNKENNRTEIEIILKMLEEGKINAQEAQQLIEAINVAEEKPSDFQNIKEDFVSMGRDLKDTIVRKYTEVEKDLKESGALDFLTDAEFTGLKPKYYDYEDSSISRLSVKGKNSTVKIRKHADNKTRVSIYVLPRDFDIVDKAASVEMNDGVLEVSIASDYKGKASILIELPDSIVDNMDISSKNGSINCQQIAAYSMSLATSNGSIKCKKCAGTSINCSTSNGSVRLEECNFRTAIEVETTNGAVTSNYNTSEKINLSSTNGTLRILENSSTDFNVKTTNGNIVFDRISPYQEENKFMVNGDTVNGGITIYLKKQYGAVFECSAGRHGNVNLGQYLIPYTAKHNSFGKMYYAKGESIYLKDSTEIAGISVKTVNGNIRAEYV